ncbi:hypothetical protein [Paenibacillus ihumii]|uniref:hypothetical protein n=1 Tax=Paenibacillus ihumii TaxID=687436 RepID=UPI0006D7E8C2|nr:hypothetical protein [Paenibacillus ihumii]
MPQKSGFFDSTADDMREYPAREFAEYFARFIGNGVFLGGTRLKVTASGQDANVNVELGYGWINGYMYSVYDEPLSLPIQPATTQDRIDRVILRLDTSAPVRAIRALVVQGLPATSPAAPALVRSGNIYDLSLAQIRVLANTSIIKPENITDERLNNQVCGIVTALIDQADTTSIFNQFQAWLNTKTAEYQQQWQDFMQSVQDEGFATTEYVDNRVLTGGYGVTTNSGNAYSVKPTPAPTALVEGLRVTVRINAANTGAATLNVNGLGARNILKGNGNAVAAGNLKSNSVYTLVYSGTAFILQGEGGEYGTAVAADVLKGKTIGTESGIITGTMANNGAQIITPSTVNKAIPAGHHNGSGYVIGDPDLISSNIRSGIDIFGVSGNVSPGGLAELSYHNQLRDLPPNSFSTIDLLTLPRGVRYISFSSDATESIINTFQTIEHEDIYQTFATLALVDSNNQFIQLMGKTGRTTYTMAFFLNLETKVLQLYVYSSSIRSSPINITTPFNWNEQLQLKVVFSNRHSQWIGTRVSISGRIQYA